MKKEVMNLKKRKVEYIGGFWGKGRGKLYDYIVILKLKENKNKAKMICGMGSQ